MFLAVETDDKGRDIDDLFSDTGHSHVSICPKAGSAQLLSRGAQDLPIPDMSLSDQNSGVVDTLGQPKLVHASLQSSLQEIFDFESKHVIEFHTRFIEDTDTHETTDEGISFEQTLGILLIEGKKLTVGNL